MTHDWESEHAKRTSWGVWPAEYMVRALSAYQGPRDRALDIGTGGGAHIRLLQETGFHGIWANDISQTACDRLRSLDDVIIHCNCINRLNYAPGFFDVIIDNLSLTNVEKPDWDKIASWLRPGGMLVTAQFLKRDASFPESWFHQWMGNGDLEECAIEIIDHERYKNDGKVCDYVVHVATYRKVP